MRMKVVLKFTDAEREQITDFAREVGISVDEMCKRSVFYAMNDAYRRAAELERAQGNGTIHDTTPTDAQGNSSKVQPVPGTSGDVLPDQGDQDNNS